MKLINETLKTGMTREEAQSTLENFGPIGVAPGNLIVAHQTQDRIRVKICLHPFNHLVLLLSYDLDGKLVSWVFEMED